MTERMLRMTPKGSYVYRRAQELVCEGKPLNQAYEVAEKEAEELESAGAWRKD
jgi:hypothetical protein